MGFLLHRSGLHRRNDQRRMASSEWRIGENHHSLLAAILLVPRSLTFAETLFSRGLSTGEKSFAPPLCSDRSSPRVLYHRRNEEKGTRNEGMQISNFEMRIANLNSKSEIRNSKSRCFLAPLSWFLVPSLKRVGFPGGSRKISPLSTVRRPPFQRVRDKGSNPDPRSLIPAFQYPL